jgi:hypothetical protein
MVLPLRRGNGQPNRAGKVVAALVARFGRPSSAEELIDAHDSALGSDKARDFARIVTRPTTNPRSIVQLVSGLNRMELKQEEKVVQDFQRTCANQRPSQGRGVQHHAGRNRSQSCR